jgi:hypothetical protein
MPVGIEEIISEQINIYPNPNSGKFFIDLPEQISGEVLLRIININGQLIYTTIIPRDKSQHFEINPGVIQKGFYMVELTQSDSKWIKKLVVK